MRTSFEKRILSGFLAAVMAVSTMSTTALTAYADDDTTVDNVQVEIVDDSNDTNNSTITSEENADKNTNISDSSKSSAAQAFIDAVNTLDQKDIVSKANAFGLARNEWMKDTSNETLSTALDEAVTAQEEAAAPLDDALALYENLTAEEKKDSDVKAAYATVTNIWNAMSNAMDHPTAVSTSTETDTSDTTDTGKDVSLDEIAAMMYDRLPDAPTGYYICDNGLPVATGTTKIGLEPEDDEYVACVESGYNVTPRALDSDGLTMVISKNNGDSAIIPVMVQAEYPENDGVLTLSIPDNVKVLDYSFTMDNQQEATDDNKQEILSETFEDVSASCKIVYLKADSSFALTLTYNGPTGTTIIKTMNVDVRDSVSNGEDNGANAIAAELIESKSYSETASGGSSTFAYTGTVKNPAPSSLTITSLQKVGGTWLNFTTAGPGYCCDHGYWSASGAPYVFSYYSTLSPEQTAAYNPSNPVANQMSIWGGLGQLSLNSLYSVHNIDDYEDSEFAASTYSLRDEVTNATAYEYYDDEELWIIENYPESDFAKQLISDAEALAGGSSSYDNNKGQGITAIYTYAGGKAAPASYHSAWQRIAIFVEYSDGTGGTEEGGSGEETPVYYYAELSLDAQTASDEFSFTYKVNTDKFQRETYEKVDDAVIDITPLQTEGEIDGGTWTLSPATKQTVTTSGHTNDNNYHNNGGDASASWTLKYSVSKTVSSNEKVKAGPCTSQAEADAQAQAAKKEKEASMKADAEKQVANAIASAKSQLDKLQFKYYEANVPYGFEFDTQALGSDQTITVQQGTNNDYPMNNDEWSLQVNILKVDSETNQPIQNEAKFEVYEWDTVKQQYIPYNDSSNGNYNMYRVAYNGNGSYSVVNDSSYAKGDSTKSKTMYYTQRNEGKFIIVETEAPAGYYGDWTNLLHPGTAGSIVGKRAYYIEITKDNDHSTINLDNKDYSADIGNVDGADYSGAKDATIRLTDGSTQTVHIYKDSERRAATINYKESNRTYDTDNSKDANNEDEYHTVHSDSKFENDRVLGEISISKVDLDAIRYVDGRDTDGDSMKSGQTHADSELDGAVYDLYAAEDIKYPDGRNAVVDYSTLKYEDSGKYIWTTTIKTNGSNEWKTDYLPVLKKDNLVASAEIKDGWLTFSNLYLGKYLVVERSTGVTLCTVDSGSGTVYTTDGQYPVLTSNYTKVGEKEDEQHETITPVYKWVVDYNGQRTALATRSNGGEYSTWIYRNQYSSIAGLKRNDDGTVAGYDIIYESFAKGYLCDETNYYLTPTYSSESKYVEKLTFEDNRQDSSEKRDTTTYNDYYNIKKSNATNESQDQVMKSDILITKSGTDNSSNGSTVNFLEDAGFTLYLISDLSCADELTTDKDGQYNLEDVLSHYLNAEYDETHPKYDFSGETQAIAKSYERDADEISAYNKTLTLAGTYSNGKGNGWVSTGRTNEYQLSEIFSNEDGRICIKGVPYGQYLLVETTTPKSRFQADPILINVSTTTNNDDGVNTANASNSPISSFADIKVMSDDATVKGITGNLATGYGGYIRYLVNNESVDAYLRITKYDNETGLPVLQEGTAWQLYYIDAKGNYKTDKNGNPKLVTMTAVQDGSGLKKIDTFYSNANGCIILPEKLPSGRYRLVEVEGPTGYYNEWIDTAQYGENGILKETGKHYYDFRIGTNDEETSKFRDDRINVRDEYLAGTSLTSIIKTLAAENSNDTEYAVEVVVRELYNEAIDNGYSADDAKSQVLSTVGKTAYTTGNGAAADAGYTGSLSSTSDIDTLLNATKYLDSYVIYKATSEQNEDGQDNIIIDQEYINKETIGQLTIRKTGEVLVGFDKENSKFVYETRPLAGATYTITAAEDIYTQDGQVDANGNRTLWYAKGDVVATVTTGDGSADLECFSPIRTQATYDFLTVYHTSGAYDEDAKEWVGGYGEVTVTLPLGKYTVTETEPPYGYVLNEQSYTVEFTWDNQAQEIVMASNIDKTAADGTVTNATFEPTRVKDLNFDYDYYEIDGTECKAKLPDKFAKEDNAEKLTADNAFIESQALNFYNEREKARLGVYKIDGITGKYVAGAVFTLYATDDIYTVDGDKLFKQGDIIAVSPETIETGYTYFDVDVPIQGQYYNNEEAKDLQIYDMSTFNSGHYVIFETKAPKGYYLDEEPKEVWFTYDGQVEQVLDSTCADMPTVMHVSKTDLTNGKELPGARLEIIDKNGNTVEDFTSSNKPKTIYALHFDEDEYYTLRETKPADGYTTAEEITFKLVRRVDENGKELDEVDVYYKDGNEWKKLDKETVIMKDDITRLEISKKDITNNEELPGAKIRIEDNNGNIIDEWTSTDKPHYIEKIPVGDYKLIEMTAPNGYLVAEVVNFTVLDTGEIQHVTMYDKPNDTGILIYKIDADTKEPLQGADFQILDAKTGEVVIYTTWYGKDVTCYNTTNASGNIWFGLEKGDYYYQEIHAPAGYEIDSTLYPFSITDEIHQVEVTFENRRSPLYGLITFFTSKKNKVSPTGTLANGVGTEETATAETANGTTTERTIPTEAIVGCVLVALALVGGGVYVAKRKKGKDDIVDVSGNENSDDSEDETTDSDETSDES